MLADNTECVAINQLCLIMYMLDVVTAYLDEYRVRIFCCQVNQQQDLLLMVTLLCTGNQTDRDSRSLAVTGPILCLLIWGRSFLSLVIVYKSLKNTLVWCGLHMTEHTVLSLYYIL